MTEREDGKSALFVEERHRAIYERLREASKVTVDELVERFGMSAATIRNDLARLEEQGLAQRTHGGAILASPTLFEPPYAQRQVMRQPQKRAIARAAAELVQDGQTVMLDAGTTTFELALGLRDRRRLTVVTNSLANAHALMDSAGVEVVLIGGTVQPRRRATLGPQAARFLDEFHVDRAFLAFNGVHCDAGFTVVDFDAAELKRRMAACSSEVTAVADSAKIGQVAFARALPLSGVSQLITDGEISAADLAALRECGVEVVVAE